MIIWVSGPTGSGKSTLAGLAGRRGYRVIREDLPQDLFQAFRADPARHCASLQEAIMLSRLAQWRRVAGAGKIVFDRSVDEDADIFCRMHHEHGLLDYGAYARLRLLAKDVTAELPKPDLILFLSPPIGVLTARLLEDGHPAPIVEGIARQVSLYEEWIQRRKEAVIRIDNSRCSLSALESLFGEAEPA